MKFLITRELGRLARWLRILGEDVVYTREDKFSVILIEALKTGRCIITRQMKKDLHPGANIVTVVEDDFKKQLKRLLDEGLVRIDKDKLFTRCIICNTPLSRVNKKKVEGRVPEYVYKNHEEFMECPECSKVYWQGTHWGKMEKVLNQIKEN